MQTLLYICCFALSIKVRSRLLRDGKTQTVYLDLYSRGRRQLEYLNLYLTGNRAADRETFRVAEAIASKRTLELIGDEHGFATLTRQRADFIEYCRKLADTKHAHNIREVWRKALEHFTTFCGGRLAFSSLNHSTVQAFHEYLLARIGVNSAAVYLARIKTACRQAMNDGILTKNPAVNVTIRKQATERAFLSLDELRQLADTKCSNAETKAAFLFSCFSGLRYSDIKSLRASHVRQLNGLYALEFRQTKTGTPIVVPLCAQAVAILKHQLSPALPVSRSKFPLDPDLVFQLGAQQTTDKALQRWVKKAGITKKISFHCGRHTFATLSLTSGIDVYTLSKLLGHRHIGTTEIYAKIVDQKKLPPPLRRVNETLTRTIAHVPFWLNLGDYDRPNASRRGRYFAEWCHANGGPPRRRDRLSDRVFCRRMTRVEVGDTLGPAPYSVVRRILVWENRSVLTIWFRVHKSISQPLKGRARESHG